MTELDFICSQKDIMELNAPANQSYIAILRKGSRIDDAEAAIKAMAAHLAETGAVMAYSDYIDHDGSMHPLIPYSEGALRDGFDFGPLIVIDTAALNRVKGHVLPSRYAGWYGLRLALSRAGKISHIDRPLYRLTCPAETVSQFSYQDASVADIQREMEEAVTDHLRQTGAYISPADVTAEINHSGDFPVEASVIIPVRNRARTIADAIHSALDQITDFNYNVIVVDNHSTDGTTEIIKDIANKDNRVIHIIPDTDSHGIGGCWNIAVNSPQCGRYAVQLDSDDVYSGPDTLQCIVDTFRKEKCAMVVGAYTLTGFDRNEIAPGLIAHREWTDTNGRNNALRINGLGAPRAFFTPVVREIQFPDVSYGEDYAMGLAISRRYRIGRIFDSIYLCRRWTGNSDASLSLEAANRNDLYKDSLRTAEIKARRQFVSTLPTEKTIEVNGVPWHVVLLPGRAVSTNARLDAASLAARPCFLCAANRPKDQKSVPYGDYEILENPYPVFSGHLTIVSREHTPQQISDRIADMVDLAMTLDGYTVFYNGPKCGASAPDHCHFQAVPQEYLPINHPYPFERIYRVGKPTEVWRDVHLALQSLEKVDGESEPRVNVAMRRINDEKCEAVIIPRRCHRSRHYGDIHVSPGAIDVFGTLITVTRDDFNAITPALLSEIWDDVTFTRRQPEVKVGLVEGESVDFKLNGPYNLEGEIYRPASEDSSFTIRGMMIGKQFHWQQNEDLTFRGALQLIHDGDATIAVNHIPVEQYLESVIASEMSASASLELLKAHAVISRSWLLAQMEHKPGETQLPPEDSAEEHITWYDHDNHTLYDVCADDHCQRYQGITRVSRDEVHEAIVSTWGEVLTDRDGELCDARFSKCCGGKFEKFSTCWQPRDYHYLAGKTDTPQPVETPDLTTEQGASEWITSRPSDPFCANTTPDILSQVLNGYDQSTTDFYRWEVRYTSRQLRDLLLKRSGIDFGEIVDLIPLSRGTSGRIWRLKIVGTDRTMIVGKELEIRRWLSETHLYSSAFIVSRDGDDFVLKGAGWGHGVGLCQIGAAVMATKGYTYRQILSHYYPDATIQRRY